MTNADRPRAPGGGRKTTPGRILGTVGGIALGVVLLYAAFFKAIDPDHLAESIRHELPGIPLGATLLRVVPAQVLAWLVTGIEVLLGSALLLGVRRPLVLVPATLLVLFFLALTGSKYYRVDFLGEKVASHDCGCFGRLHVRSPKEAFFGDLLLLAPGLVLAWCFRPRMLRARKRLAVAGVLAAGAVGLAAVAPSIEALDAVATNLRTGQSVSEVCHGEAPDRTCLSNVVPPLTEGEHLVVLADLNDPAFASAVAGLNARFEQGVSPPWVVTPSDQAAVFRFQATSGARFPVTAAPEALLRPLYRRLPRSFVVREGKIVEVNAGLPAP